MTPFEFVGPEATYGSLLLYFALLLLYTQIRHRISVQT